MGACWHGAVRLPCAGSLLASVAAAAQCRLLACRPLPPPPLLPHPARRDADSPALQHRLIAARDGEDGRQSVERSATRYCSTRN